MITTHSPLTNSSDASAHWAAIESLLHAALARPLEERAAFLDEACANSADRREVEALIVAHEQPGRLDAIADMVLSPLLAAPPSPHASVPGVPGVPQLERYRVIEKLGGGGMGIVYRARDERLERDVALKFLPPHLSMDEAAKKRFMVEARAVASLEHPNICTVHEIGETSDGQLYIVMACYEGETLDARIARGPLPVNEAVRIASDVARGLVKAHERGIIHRDIKPSNIMLTLDGVVKILDFGIAKLKDTNLTNTGGGIGTLGYMSPEQAFGDQLDHRTDIWAVGIVLHEMLTGGRPFRGPGEQAVLFSILTQDVDSVAGLRSDVPSALDVVMRRALAKKVADRFASAQEMLTALGAIADALPAQQGQPFIPRAVGPMSIGSLDPTDSVLTRAGERRHATVVATGIADYSTLVERLAPEFLNRVGAAVRNAATDVAARYGGIVNHFAAGDALLLFGVPASHDDDFLRAVRATLELHDRVRELSTLDIGAGLPELRMRSGVDSGSIVAQRQRSGDQRFHITGTPMEMATRLAAFADVDAVLVSPDCYRLVAPFVVAEAAVAIAVRSDSTPVIPYRITGSSDVHSRLEVAERAGLTPFAGRSRELHLLEDQLAAAVRGEGRLAVVTGEPGAGKSRLLHELRHRADDARARLGIGRCDAYGRTTPYLPFVEAIRGLLSLSAGSVDAAAELGERVRAIDESLTEFLPHYCALLSIASVEHALPRHLQGEHLQGAMLEALAALLTLHARQHPTVLLLEDWHWADEASRTALEQLAEIAPSYPLLVVVSCRPEGGMNWKPGEHRTLMHLGPLSADASLEIIRDVVGATSVDPELARLLHERTGGNPFFLEEICHALVEESALVVRDGAVTARSASGTVQVPETVQAVIRTRMDRLTPEARDALRVASVIGREFSRGVLEATAGLMLDIVRQIDQLRGSGLIQQMSVAPEPVYRFKHVLTQEVAYDTLLEHQRQMLHAAAGRAIERCYAARLDEHLARLAHHFGRAGEWAAAVRYGIRGADRTQALSQFADALAMLDQTLADVSHLADERERREARSEVLLRQERVCETLGLRARQLDIVDELIALLAPFGGSARLAEVYLRQGDVCTLLQHFDAADRALGTALRLSREHGDRAAERNALRSIGLLRSHEGRTEEAVQGFEQALAIDVELGETAAAAGDVASLGNVLRRTGRHREALDALEQALEYLSEHKDPTKRCAVMTVIAAVLRDLGDDGAALRYLEAARDLAVEQRLPILASFSLPGIAQIQLERGLVEAAIQTYRQAVGLSRRARHAEGLAQSLRALGEVLFGLSRYGEALPHLREAAELFAQLEDRASQTLTWRRIATAHERCGEADDARRMWEAVRDRCATSGDPAGEALALEGIARCERQRGMRAAATGHYEDALARAIQAGDRDRQLALRNTLGVLRWEDGLFPEALRHYEAALRLCRETEDRVHEGLILNSLGATLERLHRYDEARTALEEGAQVNRVTKQRQLEAHSYGLLGNTLLASGRVTEAREAIERSLAMRPSLGDRRGEGWMLEHLSRALRIDGRDDEARAAREGARAIARELDDGALAAALALTPEVNSSAPNRTGE